MRHLPDHWDTNPHVPSFAGQAGWEPPPRSAGLYRRVFATVVDLYVVSLLYVTFVALGISGARLGAHASGVDYLSDDLARALVGPFLSLWWALWWVYIAFFTRHGGQTLGKMLLRIRVTRIDGEDPSWIQAVLRPIGYLLSWLPLGLGFVWAAVPPAKRALHDRLLGTRVIRVSSDASPRAVRTALGVWLVLTAFSGVIPASAVVVDRILATANNQVITLSDLAAHQTLAGSPTMSHNDALHTLIDRQLLLEEADRFAIPPPSAADVSARIDAITAQLGGPEELKGRLARLGWDSETLRAWVADDLRVAEFLDQRIYFFVLVTPQDIDVYYDGHREDFSGLSPEDVRAAINKRFIKERGDEKRDQFLSRLRDKARIRINPPD